MEYDSRFTDMQTILRNYRSTESGAPSLGAIDAAAGLLNRVEGREGSAIEYSQPTWARLRMPFGIAAVRNLGGDPELGASTRGIGETPRGDDIASGSPTGDDASR